MTAITCSEKERENGESFAQKSNQIVQWYNNNLYQAKPLEMPLTFYSHAKRKNLNGFWRLNTIEYDQFIPSKSRVIKSFIPHEIGHFWCHCTGDAAFSDRVLEEGGAEWSANLYRYAHDKKEFERARKNSMKSFRRRMEKKDKGKKLYPDAHGCGFWFFNEVYEKYGFEKVKACIWYFIEDEERRNMKAFLEHAGQNEPEDVYSFLKEKLATAVQYCQ